jgi:hypothetical protein
MSRSNVVPRTEQLSNRMVLSSKSDRKISVPSRAISTERTGRATSGEAVRAHSVGYPDYPRNFLTRRRTTGVVTAQAEARASMEEALPDPTNRNPPAQQPASLERGKRRLLIRRFWSTAIGLAAVGKNKKADLGSGRGTFRSKMS